MTELSRTFDPAAIEAHWYARWEGEGLFRPDRPDAEPFTIVIPPPNVTGSLHIGHALDNTLQDILIRHARLQGKDALWVVGTDHAGIATQMVVERNLASQSVKRSDMPREAFLEHVWEWKATSGGAITRQLRRLGASCDWANERFTMDPGFSAAVARVFVHLHREGLLYRDKRLVNWDPEFRTAISDLEVETKEKEGKFWHFKYPLEEGGGYIHVATTRPETMLADMAVAVHPRDARYTRLVGKRVRLPVTGRLVPIVADEHADPALGSGAVKITPGHDFNDFEVGRRIGFRAVDMLNMLSQDAKVVQTADGLVPDELLGLDRFAARDRVVAMLDAAGCLERVEDRVIQLPYGDRSGAVIEPWLTDQWYVDAKTLAGPAIEAVRSGAIRIVPKSWEKTWFNWLENIQPWCVSRQLWWGHQIPAWYDDKGKAWVAETEAEAQALAGEGALLRRDPDVLDTWFSSALWPFVTLGWPEPTATLRRHYPNDVLVSGFDIIFFWDARMAMQGLHFMEEVPWKTLYLHGLVRDSQGRKMSKSLGNTVDPLGLIDRYGADALRFTMAAMESQGRDIKLDERRVEGYRNFATKLWNAARFCQSNGIGASAALEPPAARLAVNRWIVGETVKTVQALDLALAELRFDESANAIYHFVWDNFCDWYLELIKPVLSNAEGPVLSNVEGRTGPEDSSPARAEPVEALPSSTDEEGNHASPPTQAERVAVRAEGPDADETRAVGAWVLDQILVMLHPFMPFITEELWNAMGARPAPLIVSKWPMPDARALDPEAGSEIDWLIRLVGGVRAARAELNVPAGARLKLHVRGADSVSSDRLARNRAAIERLARVVVTSGEAAGPAAQLPVDEATWILPLEGAIDLDGERARLARAIGAAEKERDSLAARLANPSFVTRARPEAVEKARVDHDEHASAAIRYRAALERLG